MSLVSLELQCLPEMNSPLSTSLRISFTSCGGEWGEWGGWGEWG